MNQPKSLETRVSILEEALDRMDHLLFGNGQIGLIKELLKERKEDQELVEKRHSDNIKRLEKLEANQMKIIYLCIGVYIAWGFLTGNGFATLTHVIESWPK